MSTDCEACAAEGLTRDAEVELDDGRFVCDEHAIVALLRLGNRGEHWTERATTEAAPEQEEDSECL